MSRSELGQKSIVWLGLGSNLGDGRQQIQQALDELIKESPSTRLLRVSSFYRTRPWGIKDQPAFTNAVAEISTDVEPLQLLKSLQDVEKTLGRNRQEKRWGPRCIDMDLLLWGDSILFLPGLTVPHPRMEKRAFVLIPLIELEPGLVIPATGSVQSCLARLPDQGVSMIAE
jgi:2-amino-4-hydroxy-6-hydroxymethyldihydropteridine diphosphokinase